MLRACAFLLVGSAPACGGASKESSTQESPGEDWVVECTPLYDLKGFVSCTEDYDHRPRAEACGPPLDEYGRAPGTCDPSRVVPPDTLDCSGDADCTERLGGRCNYEPDTPAGPGGCACDYPCASDADCGNGFVCWCAGLQAIDVGTCVPATCTTDADCDSNFCGITRYACTNRFSCFSEADSCAATLECEEGGETCQADATTGVRSCTPHEPHCMGG